MVVGGNESCTGRLLLNAREAAHSLAISPRKLWELTKLGRITCVRVDRSVRYYVDDLRKFIEQQREGG
jgi:hypothetical protein